jgi:hypothetical protein
MKLLSTIVAIFMATSQVAQSSESIDVLFFNSVGGTTHNAALNLIETSDMFTKDTVNLPNCAAASNYLKNTDKPTVAIWDIQNYALSEDKSCDIVDENMFITVYSQAFYNICTLTTNAEQNTMERLLSGDAKIGGFNGLIEQAQLKGIMKELGSSSRTVPYSSTGDMLAALEIGEVDYLYTARYTDKMTCVATADPYSDGDVPKLNTMIDSPLSESSFSLVVIGVNVDKSEVHEAVRQAVQNENWKTKFPAHKSVLAEKTTEEQFSIMSTTVESLREQLK